MSSSLLAPVVLQTSSMDCGPASLACVMRGLGLTVSYEGLRDAVQTGQDGTSIDVLEDVAVRLGLRARQVMVPREHALRHGRGTLPSVLLGRTGDDITHFLVAWRRHGDLVQVMDPALGRRWVGLAALEDELFAHTMAVPAEDWREYAASSDFLGPLRARLRALRIPADRADSLVASALADETWASLGALDAAVRWVASGSGPGGRDAAGKVEEAVSTAATAIPVEHWSVRPDPDAEGSLRYTGAVLLIVDGADDDALVEPEVAARVFVREPGAAAALAAAAGGPYLRRGLPPVAFMAAMFLFLAAFPLAYELIDTPSGSMTLWAMTLAALALAVGTGTALSRVRRSGRTLESGVRRGIAERVGGLPHVFFASRPISDLVERAHAVHEVRELPVLAARSLGDISRAVVGSIALLVLSDQWLALLVGAASLLPLAATRLLAEAQHRSRTVAGALNSYHMDAALGLHALRSVDGEPAFRGEYARLLRTWRRAELSYRTRGALLFAVADLLAWIPLVLLIGRMLDGDMPGSTVLAVALAGLWVVDAGQSLGAAVQEIPRLVAVVRRVAVLLTARLEPAASEAAAIPPGPLGLELVDVGLVANGAPVLNEITLTIPSGQHVAVVGASGSGKSSLLRVLAGLLDPTVGKITANGVPIGPPEQVVLRGRTAWVDPSSTLWSGDLGASIVGAEHAGDPSPLAHAVRECDLADVASPGMRIQDNAANLSGGEAQRVRLARAWARGTADLVVLDEPGQGLESKRRSALGRVLRRRFHDKTLLCVTHDVSDSLAFDRVLVMVDGEVAADGDPQSLAAEQNGPYAALLAAEERLARIWVDDSWVRVQVSGGRLANVVTSPASGPGGSVQALAAAPSAAAPVPDPATIAEAPAGPADRLAPWFVAAGAALVAAVGVGTLGWTWLYRAVTGSGTPGPWAVTLLGSALLFGLTGWLFAHAGVRFGVDLRTRLLTGMLRQDPDEPRRLGVGAVTARVLDAEVFETLAVRSATLFALSSLEIVLALLAASAAAPVMAAALVAWLALVAAAAARTAAVRREWTEHRAAVTTRLSERLLGHATELIYGPPARDDARAGYEGASARMDRHTASLRGLLPVGWLFIGLLVVAATDTDRLAAVAAVMLGYLAVDHVAQAADEMASAASAWRGFRGLLRPREAPHARPSRTRDGSLHMNDIVFTYPDAHLPALTVPALRLEAGSRTLITGPSGSGKSTLASILGGVRTPQHGDVGAAGVLVPQAGDNHIFRSSLAFNLLIGGQWPPDEATLDQLDDVVRLLGLDSLVGRMPMGLAQPVGECGWQLSHGESARVQIARALLAGPPAALLDESFAALDPITLERILAALQAPGRTLALIAHP